ncbi:cytochrome P450 [Phenylobacterium sp. LjRoot219]|uniref:cytochrome P450 n=1 Tax=Phenylobacterium sp. LjRoot219 TaxID=3342283 RepID=UPI003ED0F379
MPLVSDLALSHLPLEEPDFARDPTPFMNAARGKHPFLATSNLGYVVTEYQAMKEILYQDAHLHMPNAQIVQLMGAEGTGWGRFTNEMMLSRSGAEHQRLRGSVAEAFTPRAVNRLRPLMRKVVSDLLDDWAPKGAFDFADFASYFPIRVMFGLIGGSPEVIPQIRSSLETQGSSFALDPTKMPTIEAAYQVLWRFVDEQIAERGPNAGHDDLLDALIEANTSGAINDVELRQTLLFLFGAGYDTSKNLLTLIMHAMLQDPPMWVRCAEDRPYCDKVVEEALRHTSPANPYRTVLEEFEYRDVRFPKDCMLIFPLGVAGRDPSAFDEPARFNPERTHANRQIAFGRGMHICLGQYLARAQIEEGVHLIAQRLTHPRATAKETWRPFPGVWGLKTLPIAFDPAPRRPDEDAATATAEAAPRGCPVSGAAGR